jgi:isochorismate synthase/2-succinyl-5-enolpyruvyl-6-hydroxy-3-cyclohexene-1-carboxylate synthase/2-succinyl-6-hydroxy-2,4-cyclohexadiene-1-carboxylate synthase/O-succinylbenzoate synthase
LLYWSFQVIKPSVIGGFENAALLARWAQHQGKMAVVSATFESGLGLSAYIQFSCYLELQDADICKAMKSEPVPSIAHGLGTYRWLEEDVATDPLRIGRDPYSGFVEASVADANRVLQKLQINDNVICRKFTGEQVSIYELNIDAKDYSCFFKVREVGQRTSVSRRILHHSCTYPFSLFVFCQLNVTRCSLMLWDHNHYSYWKQ